MICLLPLHLNLNMMQLPMDLQLSDIFWIHSNVPVSVSCSNSFAIAISHCFECGDRMALLYDWGSSSYAMNTQWVSALVFVMAALISASVAAVPKCGAGLCVCMGWSRNGRFDHLDPHAWGAFCSGSCARAGDSTWVTLDSIWTVVGSALFASAVFSGTNSNISMLVGIMPRVSITAKSPGVSSSMKYTSLTVINFPVSTSSSQYPFVSFAHHPSRWHLTEVTSNFHHEASWEYWYMRWTLWGRRCWRSHNNRLLKDRS